MKNNQNNYCESRAKWSREQAELFMNTLEKITAQMGIKVTPMQYVKAYKLCIEDYKFEYPTEYKITELISTADTYERMLDIMTKVMKRFRLEFYKTRKKSLNRHSKKRKAA